MWATPQRTLWVLRVKTTAEMQDIALYAGWDIEDDQTLADEYPVLTLADTGALWKIKSVAYSGGGETGGGETGGGETGGGETGGGETGGGETGGGETGGGETGGGETGGGETGGGETGGGETGGSNPPVPGNPGTTNPVNNAITQAQQQVAQAAVSNTSGLPMLTGMNGASGPAPMAAGPANSGNLQLSGGMVFVPADDDAAVSAPSGQAGASQPAGLDASGFMRVFVTRGGINVPAEADAADDNI